MYSLLEPTTIWSRMKIRTEKSTLSNYKKARRLENDRAPKDACSYVRTHAQTDGQPENINPPVLSIRRAETRKSQPGISIIMQVYSPTLPAQYAQQGLRKRPSVRPSVASSYSNSGGFAAERPAGRRYRSITNAGAQQQRRRSTALSRNYGQCHVNGRADEAVNTDLFNILKQRRAIRPLTGCRERCTHTVQVLEHDVRPSMIKCMCNGTILGFFICTNELHLGFY